MTQAALHALRVTSTTTPKGERRSTLRSIPSQRGDERGGLRGRFLREGTAQGDLDAKGYEGDEEASVGLHYTPGVSGDGVSRWRQAVVRPKIQRRWASAPMVRRDVIWEENENHRGELEERIEYSDSD